MTYPDAVAALSRMELRGWRLELDRMFEFASRLGVPCGGSPKYIHVAGTNGKGSTTAFVQNILVGQGWRAGAYYSPFVYDLRERVQFGLAHISEAEFTECMDRLLPVADSMVDTDLGGPTEFEAKTGVGFMYWNQKQCDAVALEVGLGGRLDATNIVNPAASIITNIGLDHTHILGGTHALIAKEKAGIIKPGKPVVVGDLEPSALETVLGKATECESPVWRFGQEIVLEGDNVHLPTRSFNGLKPGLVGSVQNHNMALAIAACEMAGLIRDPAAVAESVATTRLPGRMETIVRHGRTYILDGAHNQGAGASIALSLEALYPGVKWTLVTGMFDGHDPSPFYKELTPLLNQAFTVPIQNPRSRRPSDLADDLKALGVEAKATTWNEFPTDSLTEHVLVTGSFYLLGEAKRGLFLN